MVQTGETREILIAASRILSWWISTSLHTTEIKTETQSGQNPSSVIDTITQENTCENPHNPML
jgi:hypothetical protein